MPWTGIAAAGVNLLGGLIGSKSSANLNKDNRNWSHDEAVYQRDWSSLEAVKQRQWEEQMYNQYNSPSAMMRQYREAGINPFLNADVGSSMSASGGLPSGSSAPSPTQFNTGAPIQEGLSSAVSALLQNKSVDANAANQNAMAFKNIVDAATDAWKVSPSLAKQILEMGFKNYGANENDFASVSREFNARVSNEEAVAAMNAEQARLTKEYGAKKAQSYLDQVDQSITESVAKIGLMASEGKVNDAKVKEIASAIVKNNADAFLAVAKGKTENQLRPFIQRLVAAQFWKTMKEGRKIAIEGDILKFDRGDRAAAYKGDEEKRELLMSDYGQGARAWKYALSPDGNYASATIDAISGILLGSIIGLLK